MKIPIGVYLSGGMHPKQVGEKKIFWHNEVQAVAPSGRMMHYFDPRLNRPDFKPELYHAGGINEFMPHDGWGSLDLAMAERADIVFGNLEKDNPGGEGAIAETFLHKGMKPSGLRIVVLEDPLNDGRGEFRDISDGKGNFVKALMPNRARYRRFFMFAGNPYLPVEGPSAEFPALAYQTLEEGIRFFKQATQQFMIPDKEEPFFINLVGDISLEYDGDSWISAVMDTFPSTDNSFVHYLHPDLRDGTLNLVERRALQNFFSWKADISIVYAPQRPHQGDITATYMNFAQSIAVAKAASPNKLVVGWCPDKKILDAMGSRNLLFSEMKEMAGFVRVWMKQFEHRSNIWKK